MSKSFWRRSGNLVLQKKFTIGISIMILMMNLLRHSGSTSGKKFNIGVSIMIPMMNLLRHSIDNLF